MVSTCSLNKAFPATKIAQRADNGPSATLRRMSISLRP
jgi:hypothetical protein